jgi:fatty-acid desaturase
MHHQNTDKEGDPHSPRDGGLWAHMGWLLTGQTMHNHSADLLPYVPDLRDTSGNSFWVALLTFGEGWHNNHHAHPQAARHGLAWYELDLNWWGNFRASDARPRVGCQGAETQPWRG